MRLTDSVTLAGRTAPSRVVFGPHETNLGQRRALSPRHVAYYLRRAQGGAGVIVTETASVHPSDWPYERAPLAAECREGWRRIAAACQPAGALVLAGLGHTGLQGSSAYSQAALWAPSRFTDPITRETPMVMEQPEIDALVAGFAAAAATAVAAGLDGVEIDAGPGALLRQFHSGLTNSRSDGYGTGRLALTMAVLAAVRSAIGAGHVLALRLSCDELAPWAGVTPEVATAQAVALAPALDLLTVVRGGPYSASAYRPDGHTPPMFNTELARAVRAAVGGAVPVVLQGSVVDPAAAQAALDDGAADLAEMTRAQLADAGLVGKLRAGLADRIRPCLLCNQACRVRDSRNPLVSCVVDPRTGHETQDPPEPGEGTAGRDEPGEQATGPGEPGLPAPHHHGPAPAGTVLVVGGGPAGLEAARVLGERGHEVVLFEADSVPGGQVRLAASAGQRRRDLIGIVDWRVAEAKRSGVDLRFGVFAEAADVLGEHPDLVVVATGGLPDRSFLDDGEHLVTDTWDILSRAVPPGRDQVLLYDDNGGYPGMDAAEYLAGTGAQVEIVTPERTLAPDVGSMNSPAYLKAFAEHAVTVTLAYRLRRVERSADGRLLAMLYSEYARHEVTRAVGQVVVEHGTVPNDELYDELVPGSANGGAVDYRALLAGRPQPVTGPGYQLFRIGDAVNSRNIHAAIFDALRLCATA